MGQGLQAKEKQSSPLKGFFLVLFLGFFGVFFLVLSPPSSLPASLLLYLSLSISPTPSFMLLMENSRPVSGSLGTVGIPYPTPWAGEKRRPHREKAERVEEKEKEMNE